MEKGMIPYLLRWAIPYLQKNKAPAIQMLLLIIALTGMNLFQANFIQQGVDAALEREWSLMLAALGMFAGTAALRLMRNIWYGMAANRLKARVARDMKEGLAKAMLNADMEGMDKLTDGDRVTRHNQDIDSAVSFISSGFTDFLLNPLMTLGGFCYLFYFHWKLSAAVFAAMPLLAILLNQISTKAGMIHQRRMEFTGAYLEMARDAANGAETVRAFQMQEAFAQRAGKGIHQLYETDIRYSKNGCVALGMILGVTDIPMVISLIYGGLLVLRGEIPVSLLFAYAQLIPIVATPAICVFSSLNSMKEAYRSMKRLDDILLAKPERTGGIACCPDGDLQFEKVGFQYGDHQLVLKDITLRIKRGNIIGIAGDSGAGKSTLFHLLCGFYQADTGNITVFGEDISNVPQAIYLFHDTVENNIRCGISDLPFDKVEEAAKLAGADSLIRLLPQGYQTKLEGNGGRLSGGQRQRLALARAFLRDAPAVILDEPASALDPQMEGELYQAVSSLAGKGKAVLLIAHRSMALEAADKALFFTQGRLEER